MTSEQFVKAKYPDAYVCHNTLFETVCIYEDFTFSNRISERVKSVYEAWDNAAEKIRNDEK